MARTAKTYRNQGRNPRYTTKMQTMSNGMYLTKQIIPEGFAKKMINYDIDDTGSYIRPRRGRQHIQTLNYPNAALGPVSVTDYIYSYRHDEEEITSTEDMVMSGGIYVNNPKSYFDVEQIVDSGPIYLSSYKHIVDSNVYDDNNQIITPGSVTTTDVDSLWAIRYNSIDERFEKVANENIGVLKARTIKNAYAFDKHFLEDVGRPIRTIHNNEIYTFAGVEPVQYVYTGNSDRNAVENLGRLELCKLKLINTGSGYKLRRAPLEVYKVRPSEAINGGFNLLLDSPYTFNDERGGSLFAEIGLPYDSVGDAVPNLHPALGQLVNFRVLYQYPEANREIQYKVVAVDRYNNETVINDFDNEHVVHAGVDELWVSYTFNTEGGFLRVTLRDKIEGSSTDTSCICQNSATAEPVRSYMKLQNFDLSTCKGMVSWLGRIGVYGIEGAKDTIFFSDAANPGYFPYLGNYDSFGNDILSVMNYLDYLLVITVDSVYIVSPSGDMTKLTKRKLLDNIHIPEIDAINVVMFKDEIFFKTDTEFYVLKPNKYTADATDLKNYSNSTALINFTTNFTEEVINILNETYKPIWQYATIHNDDHKQIRFEDFDVLDTRSVAKDAEIHYIYTIVPKLTEANWTNVARPDLGKLNLHIIYNTLTRAWRMYTVAVGSDSVNYNPVYYRNKQSGDYEEFFTHPIAGGSVVDVIKQTYDKVSDNYTSGDFNLTGWFNNYPYIDTGNIDIDDAFTKRFREVQFNMVNKEKEFIRFYTDFKLDGLETISATHYDIAHIVDPKDPDYGTIWVTPIEYTNLDLVGLTTLSNEEEYDKIKLEDSTSDLWNLDLSKFPDLDVVTIRFELQGRGRRGSIQLLNTSLEKYELSNLTWVYRIMNAR